MSRGWMIVMELVVTCSNSSVSQTVNSFWRDTICQNNLRLNYSPQSLSASFQAAPVYDFVGNTLVQVYTGVASELNDTNLSYSTLVNGFGNISILTFTPIYIKKIPKTRTVYYSDLFGQATGTIPDQAGTVDEVLGTLGFGINNSLLLNGELNRLDFVIRHKIGAGIGNYPGLLGETGKNVLLYHTLQLRIKSETGAVIFEFPLKISRLNVDPALIIGYYRKLGKQG